MLAPLADLYITPELDLRPVKKTSALREKRAIQELARHMIDDPAAVLPRFVDLALSLTGGSSAGLSLLESEPAPGIFRWTHLRGTLAPFENAVTPRNYSPCGITLDNDGPTLSLHPERHYNWISDASITVPEVLLVPLHLNSQQQLGTLWIVSEYEGHFHRGHADTMTELASFVSVALRMKNSEDKLQRALDQQQMISREMSHRMKNLFTVTSSLIHLSAKSAKTKEELSQSLIGRMHALASANSLVRANLSNVSLAPAANELRTLINAVVEPYETGLEKPRFFIHGPEIPCREHAVNGLALVFHELATNAAKYGALSVETGAVIIEWRVEDNVLHLAWSERGGPKAVMPDAEGFGGVLVRNTVTDHFDGALNYEWRPEGVRVTIRVPVEKIA